MKRDTKSDPKCHYCGRKLAPNYVIQCIECGSSWYQHILQKGLRSSSALECAVLAEDVGNHNKPGPKGKRLIRGFGIDGQGLFCTRKHAEWFGVNAAQHGYIPRLQSIPKKS